MPLLLTDLQIWNGCCKVECPSQAVQVLLNGRAQSWHMHRLQYIPQHSLDSTFQHCLALQQSPE